MSYLLKPIMKARSKPCASVDRLQYPVGAGLPANAIVTLPTYSRVNPAPVPAIPSHMYMH
jgi:hypothetical protein